MMSLNTYNELSNNRMKEMSGILSGCENIQPDTPTLLSPSGVAEFFLCNIVPLKLISPHHYY